jgi:hypothetical protein
MDGVWESCQPASSTIDEGVVNRCRKYNQRAGNKLVHICMVTTVEDGLISRYACNSFHFFITGTRSVLSERRLPSAISHDQVRSTSYVGLGLT